MKYSYLTLALSTLLLFSCVSMPKASVTLTQQVINEANQMHALNLNLVKQLFNERKQRLSTFINTTYIPKFIENYQKSLPDTVNYKKDLKLIISSILPVIERKKDSLNTLLTIQENQIINKLTSNFSTYTKASNSLENLVSSAARVTNSEANIIQTIDSLTHNSINLKVVENQLNGLLNKTSKLFNELQPFEKIIK